MLFKLRLFHKFFFANLSVLVLLFLAYLAINYFNHRAIESYLNEAALNEEITLVNHLPAYLSRHYEQHDNWQKLTQSSQYWREYVANLIYEELIFYRPEPRKEPQDWLQKPPPPKPSDEPSDFGHRKMPPHVKAEYLANRINLLAVDQSIIASGADSEGEVIYTRGIKSKGKIVGFLTLYQADRSFDKPNDILPRHQFKNVFYVMLAGLILAGFVSFYLTKHIAAPIQKIINTTIALANSQFDNKIAAILGENKRNDAIVSQITQWNQFRLKIIHIRYKDFCYK